MQIVDTATQVPQLARIYVKGHQDGEKKKADLTQPEILNIDADRSATKMCHQMKKPTSKVILFPTSQANIYIQQYHISSSLHSILHDRFTSHEYWTYLDSKFNWTEVDHKLIVWDTYHKMLHKQTSQHHKQLMEYTSDWLPTGQVVHRNSPTEGHRCPQLSNCI
jgi:hypothetical protein